MIQKYDTQVLYTPVATEPNILARIINAMIEGLNLHIQLPRIIIILLKTDIMHLATSYENTDELIRFVIGQLVECTQERKLKLPPWAIRSSQ